MDSGKWTILTPILVALIPVLAGIVTAIVNTPSPDKAVVTIETSVDDWSPQTGHIMLKNIGGAPATNITVFVESQSLILTAEQSSFVNIVLPKFNNSTMPRNNPQPINDSEFQFMIPKLIQGDGGFIEVTLKFDKPQTREDYNVVAIYDQGSAAGKEINYFDNYFWIGIWFFIFLAIGIVGEGIFLVYYFSTVRRKKIAKSLLNNFLSIRRQLLTDLSNDESFTRDWELKLPWTMMRMLPKGNKFARTTYLTSKYFKDVGEFIIVDDILYLISRREGKRNSNEIYELNDQLLTSIDDLLEHVDWGKYK